MKIGICDDEKSTCSKIEDTIYKFFSGYRYNAEIDVWYTGEECIHSLKQERYDIIFLDIELPGCSGVNVGKYLRTELDDNGVHIIFISSKTGYAMELFQVHPYDFLVKPISEGSINNVLKKVLLLNENDEKRLRYSYKHIEKNIPLKKIVYLRSRGRYIEIHTESGTIDEYIGKLSNEVKKLSKDFVPVGKSFVVNLRFIRSYGGSYLMTIFGEEISVTAPFRNEFKRALIAYNEECDI